MLVPLPAAGLAVGDVGAVYQIGRGEYSTMATNVVWLALTVFIAYGRSRLVPIETRGATAAG